MDEIIKLLHKEMALHPKMEAQDAVKFVYQAVFGGGHLISDEKSALSRLKAEYEAADIDSSVPVYDVLSSKYVRVNIAAVKGRLSPETLCRIFVLSSADHHDGVDKFKALASLAAEEYGAEGRKYLSSYIKSGINPVSHSLSYKAAYAPSYRVISSKYACLLELFMEIDSKKHHIIGIDGRCASGKTTTAETLRQVYGCNVFHADDFFLPPEMRTEKRLSQPGGNMDRERLLKEVLKPLAAGSQVEYVRFDCHSLIYSQPVTISPKSLNLVEGSYCLHPDLFSYYDLTVFSDIPQDIQLKRLYDRNPENIDDFKTRWIPLEEKYFSAFDIQGRCDLVITPELPAI